ncbi:transposase [Streptomyces sp. NPDC008222]|uniref:transposase n=1 Tax=Streptomyces sp. NPDC008222 TaxID=3364820 RepID=UPI0036E138E2
MVTEPVRVVIDRALYLSRDWVADEERREVAGVPEEIMFATTLEQTAAMVKNTLDLGARPRWFAGGDVYSSRELRENFREFGLGYAVGMSLPGPLFEGPHVPECADRFKSIPKDSSRSLRQFS